MKSFNYSVEEIEPPKLRFRRDAVNITRVFKLPWANHRDFVEQVLGTAAGEIGAILPDKMEAYNNIEAVEADIDDFMKGDPQSMTATANSTADATISGPCQVTVLYSTEDRTANTAEDEQIGDGAYINPHNPGAGPIILEYESDETAEVMMIPGRHFKDANNKKGKADEYFGIPVLNTSHRITIYGVKDLPPARSSLRGKVNDGPFAIPVVEMTIPNECGLFRGSTLQRRYTARDFNSGTEPAWTVTYHIAERIFRSGEMTWNHVVTGGEVKRMTLADGSATFEKADFSGLFFF